MSGKLTPFLMSVCRCNYMWVHIYKEQQKQPPISSSGILSSFLEMWHLIFLEPTASDRLVNARNLLSASQYWDYKSMLPHPVLLHEFLESDSGPHVQHNICVRRNLFLVLFLIIIKPLEGLHLLQEQPSYSKVQSTLFMMFLFYFMCMIFSLHVCACTCTLCVPGAWESYKRPLGSLDIETDENWHLCWKPNLTGCSSSQCS